MTTQAHEQLLGDLLAQHQAQARKVLSERREHQRYQIRAEGRNDPQAQGPGKRILGGLGEILHRLDLLDHAARMNDQLFTDWGDLDRTVGALEDRHAQLFLQLLDLP